MIKHHIQNNLYNNQFLQFRDAIHQPIKMYEDTVVDYEQYEFH